MNPAHDDGSPWCKGCGAETPTACGCEELRTARTLAAQGEPTMTSLQLMDWARECIAAVLTGTESNELLAEVDGLDVAVSRKVERLYYVVQQLESDQRLLAGELGRMRKRKASVDASVERVKGFAAALIAETEPLFDRRTVRTELVTATLTFSHAVQGPDDVYDWPDGYRLPQKPRADRAKARDDLKAGLLVEGCRLVESRRVRFT